MNNKTIVQDIIQEFKVKPVINVEQEIKTRIYFLKNIILAHNIHSLVLGLSGGIDSTVAGALCKKAIDEINAENPSSHCKFIGMKLPYAQQADADDVETVFSYIKPHETIISNIKSAVDATMDSLNLTANTAKGDFIKGNIKARQRMIAQYAYANAKNGLVVGTDHSSEGVMGFFTKFGDGACDVAPLFGLNKRQVRELAKALNVPENIITKAPTADLEDLNPQLKDEDAYGVTYDQIDDFLEGKKIDKEAENIIISKYKSTMHKRTTPMTIYDQD